MKKIILGIGAAALAIVLASCSSEPEKTVFVENDKKLEHDDRVPVKRFWKDPSAVLSNYDKIIISDVRTDLQLEKSWMEHSGASAVIGSEDKDLKELAAYMKNSFTKTIEKGPCRMKLVKDKGPNTVTLELAIVKVVADKPIIAAGTSVGLAVFKPISLCLIPVRSVVSHETHSPMNAYIAIEGKILDSQTGKELVLFATDAQSQGTLLDLNKYTSLYGNVRDIIDKWGAQLVEVINTKPLETGNKAKEIVPGQHNYSIINF